MTSASCSRPSVAGWPPRARVSRASPRRSTSSLTQRRQVVEQVAHDEAGLGLEERAARVGADEVEGVGHEGADPFLGPHRGRQDLVEPVAEARRVVVGGGGQHVVLAREVAVQRPARHAGRLCDLLHPEPPHAAPADEAEGRREDPLLGRR